MKADVLRADENGADIWLDLKVDKCVLRWRPGWLADDVFIDGKMVERRGGLANRDRTFAFAVEDGDEKRKLLFIVDRASWGTREDDWNDWDAMLTGKSFRGLLVSVDGETLVATGSLDPSGKESTGKKLRRFLEEVGVVEARPGARSENDAV